MNDIMPFPENWNDFVSQYEFKDKEEIYTNGVMLIPSFRVRHMCEHYFCTPKPYPIPEFNKPQEALDIVDFCRKHPGYLLEFSTNATNSNIFAILLTNVNTRKHIRKVVYVDDNYSCESVNRIIRMYVEGCMLPQLEMDDDGRDDELHNDAGVLFAGRNESRRELRRPAE